MNAIYSTSSALQDRIIETAVSMTAAVAQSIRPVEYIILPDFGQRIILRFDFLNERKVSFEEADRLEAQLRSLAGPEYWVTLTGSCYQHIPPDMVQRQIAIDRKISPEILQFAPTRHSEPIRTDAQRIRDRLQLSGEDLVWEIEIPVPSTTEEPVIRIIKNAKEDNGQSDKRQPERLKIGGMDFAVDFLQNDPSFVGLVKAYFMAEQRRMALASYVAQFEMG